MMLYGTVDVLESIYQYLPMINLDKSTILTAMYSIVDDAMKQSPAVKQALTRPGPEPEMTDAEVITIAVYQEMIGEPREDHFFRLHEAEMKSYFPHLNERSRYNRRKRDLWSVILAIRLSVLLLLKAWEYEEAVIDSAPVPAVSYKRPKKHTRFTDADYGVCTSKAMKYFGYKFHSLVTLTGIILDFVLTSAAPYDSQVVIEFLGNHQAQLRAVFGDKAYNDEELQRYILEEFHLLLWAPKKKNQQSSESKQSVKTKSRLRLMVETVNAQLQGQFHLSKHYAKSQWGLLTRVAAKITAHSIGMLINRLFQRPQLALASLAV
jgi:hypothetical protein